MTTRIVSNMHEINILMWCTWTLELTAQGYEKKDDTHQVHSTYSNKVDADAAAILYKKDDEIGGLINSKYWVVIVPVENQAPTEETING